MQIKEILENTKFDLQGAPILNTEQSKALHDSLPVSMQKLLQRQIEPARLFKHKFTIQIASTFVNFTTSNGINKPKDEFDVPMILSDARRGKKNGQFYQVYDVVIHKSTFDNCIRIDYKNSLIDLAINSLNDTHSLNLSTGFFL